MRTFEWIRPQRASDRGAYTRSANEATPHHRVFDFLPERVAGCLLTQILDRQGDFRPLTGNRNFLRLPRPLALLPALSEQLLAILPAVQLRFGIDTTNREIELYLHAYNDGTRFGRHSDAQGGGNWRRRISCVYYLHRVPRAFEGGDLVVYDARGRAHAIRPEHNSVVFFRSHLIHEVRPVTCRSRTFADSRFSINVWIM